MKYFALWTDAGRAARALATATGKPLSIEYMAVGDCNSHNGSEPPAPHTKMTELINERHRQQINEKSVSPVNPDAHIYSIIVTEEIGGFWMKEVGLFSDTGVLLAVGIMPPSYKPPIGDGAASQYIAQLQLIESPADVINVVIDPSTVLATKSYVSEQIAGVLNRVYEKTEADSKFLSIYQAVPKDKQQALIYVYPFGLMKWSDKHKLYQSTANIFELGDAVTPREGRLLADGSKVPLSAYQSLYTKVQDNGLLIDLSIWHEGLALFAVDGNMLQLPNLGGVFPRFWTGSGTKDVGRTQFTYQKGTITALDAKTMNKVTTVATAMAGLTTALPAMGLDDFNLADYPDARIAEAAGSIFYLNKTDEVAVGVMRPDNVSMPIWLHP